MVGVLEADTEPLPVLSQADDSTIDVTEASGELAAEDPTTEELANDGAAELPCTEDPGLDGKATLEPMSWDDVSLCHSSEEGKAEPCAEDIGDGPATLESPCVEDGTGLPWTEEGFGGASSLEVAGGDCELLGAAEKGGAEPCADDVVEGAPEGIGSGETDEGAGITEVPGCCGAPPIPPSQ